MPLVLANQKPHWSAIRFKGLDHLIGFADGHARIVSTLNHEHRLCDVLYLVHGSDALEVLAHLRIALIAVFNAAQIATVGFSVFEERDEVRHPNYIDRAAD